MEAHLSQKAKRKIRITEVIAGAVIVIAMVAVHLMFFFWPFRYREVHPLLEHVFQSKVEVLNYHRTYFPHPGFVAEDVTFYRHGDTHIPPLAQVKRMTVEGQWGMLLLHPHTLYRIRLEGLHVQIPPAGTRARGMDFDNGVIDTSQSEMKVETIVADGTTLDFLRHGDSPIRFEFPCLQIHDVEKSRPMAFTVRVNMPGPQGTVAASGQMGPFRTTSYATTAMWGNFTLESADLSRLQGLAGHAAGGGRFWGTFAQVGVAGEATIPDFRAGSAHKVQLDASYNVTVNGTNADVSIENAEARIGRSIVTVKGTVAGSPRKVALTVATEGASVSDLLRVVEEAEPQVEGRVRFHADADFVSGTEPFLRRLHLKGEAQVEDLRFVSAHTQETVDAFSARVRKEPVSATNGENGGGAQDDPPVIAIGAESHTRFENGVAYFPDIRADVPGAQVHLHGTFGLIDNRIHLTGTMALEKDVSHAATGWKAMLLKPVSPFFRKKDAGAVLPVAVTGTAQKPKVGSDLLHDK